jgi:hypothetical protein
VIKPGDSQQAERNMTETEKTKKDQARYILKDKELKWS